jgi:hypothetical protein
MTTASGAATSPKLTRARYDEVIESTPPFATH